MYKLTINVVAFYSDVDPNSVSRSVALDAMELLKPVINDRCSDLSVKYSLTDEKCGSIKLVKNHRLKDGSHVDYRECTGENFKADFLVRCTFFSPMIPRIFPATNSKSYAQGLGWKSNMCISRDFATHVPTLVHEFIHALGQDPDNRDDNRGKYPGSDFDDLVQGNDEHVYWNQYLLRKAVDSISKEQKEAMHYLSPRPAFLAAR